MKTFAIALFLLPFISGAAENGKFSIETTPKGMIIVDDVPVRESPLRNLNLPPGSHKVEYKSAAGESTEFHLNITSGRHLRCTYNFETTTHQCSEQDLKPAKAEGSFEAKSNMAAEVTLDGKPIGKTPIKKTKVSLGKHKLVFKWGDLDPVLREIEVNANENVEVEVNFETKKGPASQ